MAKYRLSNQAKEDLIRIHHYGVKKFGMSQADKYFDSFFEHFPSNLYDHKKSLLGDAILEINCF